MQAALELFADKGFHGTSIALIAKRANVSKGLLYNYFSGKDELLSAIVAEALEGMERDYAVILQKDSSAYEKLRDIALASARMVKTQLPYWKLLTTLAFKPDIMDKLKPIMVEKELEFLRLGVALFKEMGYEEAEQEAYLFGATLDGIFLHFMNFPEGYPLDEMMAFFLSKYER